jgi:hypothetical protein
MLAERCSVTEDIWWERAGLGNVGGHHRHRRRGLSMSHGSIVGQKQGEKGDTGHSHIEHSLTEMLCF